MPRLIHIHIVGPADQFVSPDIGHAEPAEQRPFKIFPEDDGRMHERQANASAEVEA